MFGSTLLCCLESQLCSLISQIYTTQSGMPQTVADFITSMASLNVPTTNIVQALDEARALTESRAVLARTSQYCARPGGRVDKEGMRQTTLTQAFPIIRPTSDTVSTKAEMCLFTSLFAAYQQAGCIMKLCCWALPMNACC